MPTTALGQPNPVSILFFFLFIALTLGITYWAAKRTKTTEHFYVRRRAEYHRVPKRPGPGRGLHVGSELPRHRRARGPLGV